MNNAIKRRTKKLSLKNLSDELLLVDEQHNRMIVTACTTQSRRALDQISHYALGNRQLDPRLNREIVRRAIVKELVYGKAVSRAYCPYNKKVFYYIDMGHLRSCTILFIDGTVRIAPVYAVLEDL